MEKTNRIIDIVNNYAFQNHFKEYFIDDNKELVQLIKAEISSEAKLDPKMKSRPLTIEGEFNGKIRSLDLPNLITYTYSVIKIFEKGVFLDVKPSKNDYMKIDYKNRKFKKFGYDETLKSQLDDLLTNYRYMYKIDIQNFYRSIYTHVFDHIDGVKPLDRYNALANNGKTNRLLLGNILSTLSANEIMQNLTCMIKNDLPDCKVMFFSDQFYIFFNKQKPSEILEIVEKILMSDYYEFKVNLKDSKIYTHENLIKEREYINKVDRIVNQFKIKNRGKEYDYAVNIQTIVNELQHSFNKLLIEYYKVDEKKRYSFIYVVLIRTFVSPFNMKRLKDTLQRDTRVFEILLYFLKMHEELIITYVKLGIIDVLKEDRKIYNYTEYFMNSLKLNCSKINSVYSLHIVFELTNNISKEYLEDILNDHSTNKFLSALIVLNYSELNFPYNKNDFTYNDEGWLLSYIYLQEYDGIQHIDGSKEKDLEYLFKKALNEGIPIIKKFNEIERQKYTRYSKAGSISNDDLPF